ncbi:MAG: tRNA (adenosine(37)-N6)-threonylcarbamoyltransferase complex ATPase subunit type 1 TsaE [Ruminococcaceae bacterium]|nr:tRNA (adenosine(37)-N6)-threonylcarbamoyltransferase complex ATPase subunit type 1 TsaE [Oscillospiraceae bacterium]
MAYSKITALTEEDTLKAGFEFAKSLKPGDIVALDGDLGAGKTVFTRGICKFFNVTDYVVSPTYTIVNEYKGDLDIYHFDIYRIEEEEELYNIGFYEYLDNDGIKIIEWAEKIPEAFEGYPVIRVTIEKSGDYESPERTITAEVAK